MSRSVDRIAQPLVAPTRALRETPSQTAGPYVHIGCAPRAAGWSAGSFLDAWGPDLGSGPAFPDADTRLRITLIDGAGDPVTDALVETWQCDRDGRFHATRAGFARRATDGTGTVEIETVLPGGGHPFVSVWIAARGIGLGLHTRIYFAPFDLARTGEARRATMIATRDGGGWRHAIRLGDTPDGGRETVFLDV